MAVGTKGKWEKVLEIYAHYENARVILSNKYLDRDILSYVKEKKPNLPCSLSLLSKYNQAKSNSYYYQSIKLETFQALVDVLDIIILQEYLKEWDENSKTYINKNAGLQNKLIEQEVFVKQIQIRKETLKNLNGVWEGELHNIFELEKVLNFESCPITFVCLKIEGNRVIAKTATMTNLLGKPPIRTPSKDGIIFEFTECYIESVGTGSLINIVLDSNIRRISIMGNSISKWVSSKWRLAVCFIDTNPDMIANGIADLAIGNGWFFLKPIEVYDAWPPDINDNIDSYM